MAMENPFNSMDDFPITTSMYRAFAIDKFDNTGGCLFWAQVWSLPSSKTWNAWNATVSSFPGRRFLLRQVCVFFKIAGGGLEIWEMFIYVYIAY